MIIKVSKVFAKFINETANKEGFKAYAEVITVPERSYDFMIGLDCFSWSDYDYKKDGFKVIRVSYPAEYYCCPVYLTTVQLNREFNRNAVETCDDLREMLRNMLEI